MPLNAGDHVSCCLIPGMQRYGAVVLSLDNDSIVLRLDGNSPQAFPLNQCLMIADPVDDVDYYGEITERKGDTLRLKRMWTGKRGFFRVDDVFPLRHRKTDRIGRRQDSRIFAGFAPDTQDLGAPDEIVSPRLWKLLVDINTKLGLILERLHIESEGLGGTESVPVNISATGLRFASNESYENGDVLEVRMLLPTSPAVGILAHGEVVRVENRPGGAQEVSLRFVDLVEEVRDVIIQYTLKRQRDIVRRIRGEEQAV